MSVSRFFDLVLMFIKAQALIPFVLSNITSSAKDFRRVATRYDKPSASSSPSGYD
jgi:hypothetical protein